MMSMLRVALNAGELHRVTRNGEIEGVLDGLMQHDWVVHTRHCLNQVESVVDYLARYTHRIAFHYKDYRDYSRLKTQWLDGQEFVRRFLVHILPKGFMRIRHFGYLTNCTRRRKLAVIWDCLSQPPKPEATLENPASQRCWPCLLCNNGLVRMPRQIPRFRPAVILTGEPIFAGSVLGKQPF